LQFESDRRLMIHTTATTTTTTRRRRCDYTHNLTAFGPISWPRALRKPLFFNGPVWEYLISWTHKMAASADWKDILATSPGIRRGQRQPQTGSPETQCTYITAAAPLAGHFGKSPDYLWPHQSASVTGTILFRFRERLLRP
jgi:hypothetical protein